MTDAAVAAPAAPEPTGAPIEQPQGQPPAPIESQGPQPEKQPELKSDKPQAPKPAEKPSLRDSLKRAEAEAKAKAEEKAKAPEKGAEPARKPDAARQDGPTRDETGKFASKDPQADQQKPAGDQQQARPSNEAQRQPSAFQEPPARFKSDAAASTEWASAPEAVKAATHRVVRELEQGIQKYKADAEEYGEIQEFRDLAKKHNTTIKSALSNYVAVDTLLHKDPIGGLEKIVGNLGLKTKDGSPITLRDIAGFILGQKPEQVASRQDATIQALQRQVEQLQQQLGGVSKTFEAQQHQQVGSIIAEFADKHPRFQELEADIEFFLTSDKVDKSLPVRERLSEAYKLAERLNPATQTASAPPAQTRNASDPHAEAQTLIDKGSKSVSGAPSGDEPANRAPSSSIRAALRKAAAAAA